MVLIKKYFLVQIGLVCLLAFSTFVSVNAGIDGDGVPDVSDLDNDNDGILDTNEGVCTPPSSNLNTSNYALNTALQVTPGFPLSFYAGEMLLSATLNGGANWTGGIQVQNDATVGDHIFVQPANVQNYFTSGRNATYIFDYPTPVKNLQMNPGGLNNEDGTTITAFLAGVPVTIGAGNFSNLSAGMTILSNNATDDTVESTNTTGGATVLTNTYTLTIPGPVDRVVIETGKTDNSTGNVTLGFSGIGWDCISLDTDLDGTPDYLDIDADGDMCNDADEAYAAVGTDSNGDGTYGGVVGPGQVNGDGTVTAASYTTPATTGGETTFQEGITLSVDADPTQQAFIVGGTANFSATVSSAVLLNEPVVTTSSDILYQWQVSTDGGLMFNNEVGGVNGSGTTTSGSTITYTTPTLAISDAVNQYRVVVTNLANICGDTSVSADFNAPFADLVVTKDDGSTTYTPGDTTTYTIVVTNNGPDAANGALVADDLPNWATGVNWTCEGTVGAECTSGSATASGTGDLNEILGLFPAGGVVTYSVDVTYSTDMNDYL